MNKVIIEGREYGKTTHLFKELIKAKDSGKEIFVMDSATEHADKSLIRMVERRYSDVVTFDERDIHKIVLGDIGVAAFAKSFHQYFPFQEIVKNKGKVVCFDLSYFLEKGHEVYAETKDSTMFHYYRNLYNTLSEQIALSLILCARFGLIENGFVVTDEIEFPISNHDIGKYQEGIEFLASVHPENAFGSFYEDFERIKIKQFIKSGGTGV